MYPQKLKIYNGKIITPAKIIEGGCLLVTGDTITEASESNIEIEMENNLRQRLN